MFPFPSVDCDHGAVMRDFRNDINYELCARECFQLAQVNGLPEKDRRELIRIAKEFMGEALAAEDRCKAS